MTDENRIHIRVIEMEGAKDDLESVLGLLAGARDAEPLALTEPIPDDVRAPRDAMHGKIRL